MGLMNCCDVTSDKVLYVMSHMDGINYCDVTYGSDKVF